MPLGTIGSVKLNKPERNYRHNDIVTIDFKNTPGDYISFIVTYREFKEWFEEVV